MFQQLPTAGLPFQFETWEEFEAYVDDQLTTGVIDELTEIRWDLRPAPHLGTLENRVCDGVSTFDDLAALAALMPLPGRRPRRAAGRRRDAAHDAAVARAGEQVAGRPLRPRRDRHPRRGVQRAAGHRRPRRPGGAARAGRRAAGLLGRAGVAAGHPARAGRRTSGSARSPQRPTATWSPSSTPWSRSCGTRSAHRRPGASYPPSGSTISSRTPSSRTGRPLLDPVEQGYRLVGEHLGIVGGLSIIVDCGSW